MPGRDPEDVDSDSICESNDLKDAGDPVAAGQILMELCQADLRCLDAHAHLGDFDSRAKVAIRQYEVGARICELSLGPDFDGLMPWGDIDDRPFLRCMHGFGLCLRRLERFEEAERVFERMLRLNPSDNQGVRFLIDGVGARTVWEDRTPSPSQANRLAGYSRFGPACALPNSLRVGATRRAHERRRPQEADETYEPEDFDEEGRHRRRDQAVPGRREAPGSRAASTEVRQVYCPRDCTEVRGWCSYRCFGGHSGPEP